MSDTANIARPYALSETREDGVVRVRKGHGIFFHGYDFGAGSKPGVPDSGSPRERPIGASRSASYAEGDGASYISAGPEADVLSVMAGPSLEESRSPGGARASVVPPPAVAVPEPMAAGEPSALRWRTPSASPSVPPAVASLPPAPEPAPIAVPPAGKPEAFRWRTSSAADTHSVISRRSRHSRHSAPPPRPGFDQNQWWKWGLVAAASFFLGQVFGSSGLSAPAAPVDFDNIGFRPTRF